MSELSWPHLNTSIWKVQGIASRAQRPLTALWDNNFPSLRGDTWRNNGSSTRNGSRFDLDDRHLSGEYGHPWGEIKNVMLWLWLRPICRGLLSQCTRASANGYAVGIWLPVSHAPSCIVTTRAGLNPTNKIYSHNNCNTNENIENDATINVNNKSNNHNQKYGRIPIDNTDNTDNNGARYWGQYQLKCRQFYAGEPWRGRYMHK